MEPLESKKPILLSYNGTYIEFANMEQLTNFLKSPVNILKNTFITREEREKNYQITVEVEING